MSTATAGTAARDGSHRRLLLAVLVISIVLNLFFVGGAVWTRVGTPTQSRSLEQRAQRMATELNLDSQQRAGFERYAAATRARGDRMQAQVAPLLAAAWEEAAKTGTEPDHVLRLFDEAYDKRRQFQRETIVQTLDFLSVLSPEQRSKFVALARERRGSWRSPRAQSR